MPPKRTKQIDLLNQPGEDNRHLLLAGMINPFSQPKSNGSGNYRIAGNYDIAGGYPSNGSGNYIIAGNYPIAGMTPITKDASIVDDNVIQRYDAKETTGAGFFDDLVDVTGYAAKKLLGGATKKTTKKTKGGDTLGEKFGTQLGKTLGWLTIKALGGGIPAAQKNLLVLGMLERINNHLGLPEYTEADHNSFIAKVKKSKTKGGALADPILLGADEVSKPPKRQSKMTADDLF